MAKEDKKRVTVVIFGVGPKTYGGQKPDSEVVPTVEPTVKPTGRWLTSAEIAQYGDRYKKNNKKTEKEAVEKSKESKNGGGFLSLKNILARHQEAKRIKAEKAAQRAAVGQDVNRSNLEDLINS